MFKLFKAKVSPVTPEAPFDEQEIVMGVLRNDHKIMSHVWGAQIHGLQHVNRDQDGAQKLINDVLESITQRFANDPESLSRIMRTMIKTYHVKIDPTQVPVFDRLHGIIGDYVLNHHRDIQVYQ